jgi:iron only hydrogenase large subunit-like protein
MGKKDWFYHALRIERDKCIGCTHCIRVCPTQALRVVKGKATLLGNRCVDCGECLRACPVDAISIAGDDFSRIFEFDKRIAIIPAILYGQFSKKHSQQKIVESLKKIGFTHIYESERSIPVIKRRFKEIIEGELQEMPLISSFCPAIIRLIQVRFPGLVKHIAKVKAPVDLTAIMVREQLGKVGWKDEEVGIFYVTPCAAKIAAVKSPVGDDSSYIDGVINLNSLYNRVYPEIKGMQEIRQKSNRMLPPDELLWTLTRGESAHQSGRVLAIDGIQNAIDILEKIEDGEVRNLDFLELRACDEGCAGGVLNVENRFLVAERLNRKARYTEMEEYHKDNWTELDWLFLEKKSGLGEIRPRPIMSLDSDFSAALAKMDRKNGLMESLPMVDCGVCGSPDCETFAIDVVQGKVNIRKCVFITESENEDSPCYPEGLAGTWSKNKIINIKDFEDEG